MTGEPIMQGGSAASNEISLESLGDQALLARTVDEAAALRLAAALRREPPDWLQDVVQAYTSVAVFYDSGLTCHADVSERVRAASDGARAVATTGSLFEVPCCYELGPDLERVAEATGLGVEVVIAAHAGTIYTVYALGFCPGFPYLGYLPQELQGVPRLPTPRTRVEAGSVGLTGRAFTPNRAPAAGT
jgi:inhibitor of KinA